MANIYSIKWIGEETDTVPRPTRHNTVIETGSGGYKLMGDSTWDHWKMGIIFPDGEKAEHFLKHFKRGMTDYREGMTKGDYVFHVVHFKYPAPKELYADQLQMTTDFEPYSI